MPAPVEVRRHLFAVNHFLDLLVIGLVILTGMAVIILRGKFRNILNAQSQNGMLECHFRVGERFVDDDLYAFREIHGDVAVRFGVNAQAADRSSRAD